MLSAARTSTITKPIRLVLAEWRSALGSGALTTDKR